MTDPLQHFSIAGSLIVSCVDAMRWMRGMNEEIIQIHIDNFIENLENALTIIMTDDDGKPN